jgi:hypothetical protein
MGENQMNEITLEDSRRMKLDYSLTESLSETDYTKPFYGINITKYLEDIIESDEINGVSYSKDTVV